MPMLDQLKKRVPPWLRDGLRTARWHASDVAWHVNWRAIRAAATPWSRPTYERVRANLFGEREPGRELVLSRELIDHLLRDAAPPEVPFDAVVLDCATLRTRFGDGPTERRSLHMHGKLRMTHRAIPSPAVVVLALFSDVAADYFVESMAADVADQLNKKYGGRVAFADSQASVPVLLKEVATAAGLGTIGKNALFFSRRFGFNCKLNVIFLDAPVDRYDPPPQGETWKLPDCSTCNLCVEACPVSAFDNYVITRTESCDRLIAGDFFGPRRDHMCRACITRCPVSNDVLKLRRSEGAPKRAFWDNEAQMSLVADLFMYRPSILVWILQRFYYGSELPGRQTDKKKGYTDSLTAAMNVTTSERTRDGWRLAAKRKR
jgi:ferredoxin